MYDANKIREKKACEKKYLEFYKKKYKKYVKIAYFKNIDNEGNILRQYNSVKQKK